MNNITPKQYNKILSKIPEEIRDIVTSMETSQKVFDVAKKHGLQIDQAGMLDGITNDVLIGATAVRNIVKEVENDLGVSSLEAQGIVHDIDELILKPIKELMMKTYGDEAPNKPDPTLQSHNHEEESRETISKKEILDEIENPTESQVRKVKTSEVVKEVEFKKADTKEIEEYNTELPGKSLPRSDLPDGKSTTGVVMPSQEKSIPSIKLQNIVTPKTTEPIKKDLGETKPRPTTDPYREPII